MLGVVTSKVRVALLAAVGALSITAASGSSAHAAAETLRASLAVPAAAGPRAKATRFVEVLAKEGRSKTLCERQPDRLFVRHKLGTSCLAYFVTGGAENLRRAVVFIDGDVSLDRYGDEAARASEMQQRQRSLQALADRANVRMVQISRLGVDGSSGNHGNRRKPEELVAMDAALDILKQRLGLDELVLAGQSGGSTLIASMLTRGRADIACAVLGSGAYELVDLMTAMKQRLGGKPNERGLARVVYDPSTQIAGVKADARRRVFVLADRADTRTPFEQQERFAIALEAAGHHARLIAIHATGELNHGATAYALPLAAHCARDAADARIVKVATDIRTRIEKSAKTTPVASKAEPARAN